MEVEVSLNLLPALRTLYLLNGLPHPDLICGYVPSLTASCYAVFSRYPWEACGRTVDLGKRRDLEGRDREGSEGCN